MTQSLEELGQALLARAQAAGAEAADAVVVRGTSLSIDVRAGTLEHAERAEGTDIGLRVLLGRRQAIVSSSDTSERTLDEMAERAVAMAREAPEDPYAGLADPDQLARGWDTAALELEDPTPEPAPAALEEDALAAEAAALAVKGVTAEPNRGVLSNDDRVHLHHADARNWISIEDTRFDLISMELSSVWFAGAANLYSREFYALIRPRLTSGGIFQQWVQLHHVTTPVFARMVNTLRRELEHVALFYGGRQGVLVASEQPLEWSVERARKYSRHPLVGQTLPDGRALETLGLDSLLVVDSLDRILEEAARVEGGSPEEMISTDDKLFLE
jgi:hypothetical protein